MRKSRHAFGVLCVAAFGVLLLAARARAEDVTARLTSDFVYDDGAAQVRVEIGELDEDVVSASLAVPEGFRAEGPFGGMRRTTVVGGVSRTVTEISFRVLPKKDASGSFPIGPVRLKKRSGAVVEVPVGSLRVGRRPEQSVRFEVTAEPPGGPVMLPFVARYRVLYSGTVDEAQDVFGSASNPLGLTELSIPLLSRSDIKVEAAPAPGGRAAATVRLGDIPVKIRHGGVDIGGEIFETLEFAFRVTPLATGEIDLSANVGMALVSGVEKRRDFFDRVVEVPVSKVHRAETGPKVYRVEELPAEGRPKGFTGAVGTFTIEAKPAVREVNAYDPIEVTVTIRGRGVLDRLSLPRWAEIPEIARDFELDADLDPGEVSGDSKVFKVVFRARSGDVDHIPALPFPYYDPWAGRYEVARSEPVPIEVFNVKTIRPEDAIGAPEPSGPGAAPTTEPIGRKLGIGANYEVLDEGVDRLEVAPPLLTPGFLALLALPPLLAGIVLLVRRAAARARDVPRGTPLSRALDGLGGSTPDEAAERFNTYFRERAELPDGEVTTSEIARALEARSVPPEVVERVTEAHAALVSARFAGEDPPADLEAALREVDRCLG